MSQAADLSRLRINRDRPSPAARRALVRNLILAGLAAVLVTGAVLWNRERGQVEVTVTRAALSGGGNGGGSSAGITANGYVVARTKASVSSRISGRLAYLGVSEGSVVREGDVMARLENRDYQATVRQAEAEELRAQAALREAGAVRDQIGRDLARARELLEQNLDTRRNVEDLTAQLAAAEARVEVQDAVVRSAAAAVEVARANLENTFIRAPFGGTILRKDAEVGEVVAPVATGGGLTRGAVVTMADLETLEVEVDVNEAYIAQISDDQPARIVLDAYPDTAFKGRVRQIVPTADRQRATVQVKVSILDNDPRILPEMGSRVEFLAAERSDSDTGAAQPPRVFLPAEAVRDDAGQPMVWVVRDGRVARVQVDAGPVSAGRREIRRGLGGGEQVVLSSSGTLEDGMAVEIARAGEQS